MSMKTKYGYQPVRGVLFRQNIRQQRVAEDLGVSWRHFRNVLIGRTHPNQVLREKLPKYLGVPLKDLFTPEILAKSYDPTFNSRGKKS